MNQTKIVVAILTGIVALGVGVFLILNILGTKLEQANNTGNISLAGLVQTDFVQEITMLKGFDPNNFDENTVTKQKGFLQEYKIQDSDGNTINSDYLGVDVFVKQPRVKEFVLEDGPELMFPVWPIEGGIGEYTIKVEQEGKEPFEFIFYWNGPIELQSRLKSVDPEQRTNVDGIMEEAYTIRGLDISSFEKMYYIREDNTVEQISSDGSEYLWIPMERRSNNLVVLIKKDGQWYYTKIFYGSV